jgi:hypothetical protein
MSPRQRVVREPAAMGHEVPAKRDRRAKPENNVDGCNGANGRFIGSAGQILLRHQRADGLKVGACDENKSIRLKHPAKLPERHRHFMRVNMLNTVRLIYRIKTRVLNHAHIRHISQDVGACLGIHVHGGLSPRLRPPPKRGLRFVNASASDMQKFIHSQNSSTRGMMWKLILACHGLAG